MDMSFATVLHRERDNSRTWTPRSCSARYVRAHAVHTPLLRPRNGLAHHRTWNRRHADLLRGLRPPRLPRAAAQGHRTRPLAGRRVVPDEHALSPRALRRRGAGGLARDA